MLIILGILDDKTGKLVEFLKRPQIKTTGGLSLEIVLKRRIIGLFKKRLCIKNAFIFIVYQKTKVTFTGHLCENSGILWLFWTESDQNKRSSSNGRPSEDETGTKFEKMGPAEGKASDLHINAYVNI